MLQVWPLDQAHLIRMMNSQHHTANVISDFQNPPAQKACFHQKPWNFFGPSEGFDVDQGNRQQVAVRVRPWHDRAQRLPRTASIKMGSDILSSHSFDRQLRHGNAKKVTDALHAHPWASPFPPRIGIHAYALLFMVFATRTVALKGLI